MTETQTRFVRAILQRVPAERIAELHVFPPLKQGGAETGVAVIAGRREGAPTPALLVDAAPSEEAADRADGADRSSAESGVRSGGEEGQATDETDRTDDTDTGSAPSARSASSAAAPESVQSVQSVAPAEPAEPAVVESRGSAARPAHRVAAAAGERHTVFTARYRLTLKGPDRGKWEFDVVEEADAPLVTVDAVVRGVQERAGEGGDPERLGPDALAAFAPGAPEPWTTAGR